MKPSARPSAPASSRPLGLEPTVVVLGLASLLNDTSSEIIYPLLPAFLSSVLGAGPAFIGLIEGVAESTASLLKLFSGWLSDRWQRRKPLVVSGYGVAAAVRPLIALSTHPWHVLVIRFLDRTGKGIRTAPRDALLADASSPADLGRSFGFHRGMDHAGAVLGPLLAWALLWFLGGNYRAVFALAALPALAAVVVLAVAVSEPRSHAPRAPVTLRFTDLGPEFLRYLGVVLIFTLGNSSDAFLLLRAQQLGVPLGQLPLLWAALHAVKTASSVPGGTLSDRIGRRRVIGLGWLLYAGVYAGFSAAEGPVAAWLLFCVYGLFFGLTEGAERALVADFVAPEHRGAAYGLYNLAVGIAALPASLLMGGLWSLAGAPAAFGFGALMALLAAVLLRGAPLPVGEQRRSR
ncbi:MAG: MFS transporter [Deltaproteobacteria bacterium]|nr:MFS transporter [Deltaproteobacteria bacterium]